jgi:hypothetical protein
VLGIAVIGVLTFMLVTRHTVAPGAGSADNQIPAVLHTPPATVYAGTEADGFPSGEAGIVLPAAVKTGQFSASEVSGDLDVVRRALIASRLDPAVLVHNDPSAFLALIAPDDRKDVQTAVGKPEALNFMTRIATAWTLRPDPIKVKGTITVGTTITTNGVHELTVTTSFVWVYPFAGSLLWPGDHLVVAHDTVVWAFPASADTNKGSVGMWLRDYQAVYTNADCDLLGQGVVGLAAPESDPGPTSTYDEYDPRVAVSAIPAKVCF